MAYVFLDDGGPEAEDYDSNYYYFDNTNPVALAAVERMLSSSAPRNAEFRSEFDRICQESFDRPVPIKSENHFKQWAAGVTGVIGLFASLSVFFHTLF